MHTNIFIFGDSVSFGCYDVAGGWGQRLNNFLMERFLSGKGKEFFTYNLSISGDQSNDIIDRFEPEFKLRQSEGYQNIIIFVIGLNDSAYVHSKNDNWVNFSEFKNNFRKLVDKSRQFSENILFVGLYPIDESKMDPMPYDLDKSYRNENIKRYDQTLQTAAKENGVEYIPIFNKFATRDYKKLLFDGAHPNSAGHELIFETVKAHLLEKKII